VTTSPQPGSSIVTEKRGNVLVIQMHRPEVCNAMNRDMYTSIIRVMDEGAVDDDVRCVLITGTGKFFAAGRDLTEYSADKLKSAADSYEYKLYSGDSASYFYSYLARYRKALVTAVNGHAIGGGAITAFLGDICVSAESAYFMLPELEHGVIAVGAITALPRLVSRSKAMLMVLTCKRVYAPEAERIGLVSQVVPDAEVMSTAMEIANSVAARSPTAIRMFKAALQAGPWGHTEQADFAREAYSALAETHERYERTRHSARSLGLKVMDDGSPGK